LKWGTENTTDLVGMDDLVTPVEAKYICIMEPKPFDGDGRWTFCSG
jgi:hypothetical protein